MSGAASNWREQALPDGRKYWYNISNGQTSWEEPAEVAAEALRASVVPLSKAKPSGSSDVVSSWRELTAANGRKYYYNAVTKVSMWEMPPEYAEYLERMKDPASMDKEVLESKFLALLKERGVTSKFSWEEALREVYTHPHYKLIPSLTEKKALFVKYQEMQREVEREERHQQNIRSQEEFKELLRSTSDITPNTRYSEALEILKGRAAFEAVNNPKDRARIFDEFISEVRREEADRNRQKRRRMADKLQTLLESISEIRKETPWREACELIRKHATFREDEDLKEMDAMDLLTGYENYIKYLERKYQTKMSDERDEERRRERTNRQAFREMLKELEGKGTLTAATCWSEIYPVIQGRKEFQGILSQPGSTPLDLFWDYSHQLQEHYIQVVRPIIQELKEQFGDNVGWMGNLNEEIITATVTRHGLDQSVATALRSHLLQKKTLLSPEEERAHLRAKVEAYRKEHRKLLDRLKHSIKHLQPPILIDSNYEDYKGALARDVDIAQVEDEEVRRYYFDKYIRHLRKKAGLETAPSDDE